MRLHNLTTFSALWVLFYFIVPNSSEQVQAQDAENFVPNPSFEVKDGRLRRSGQLHKAKGWVPGTGTDADLFNAEDDDEDIGAPETYRGRCKPRTGTRFAGIRAYSYRGDEPRTYISAEFPEKLGKGVLYCMKFYVRLSPLSKFAVDNVGAYISKKDITTTEEKSLIFETELVDPKKRIHQNTRVWKPVCAAYRAKGGEQYITLGTFVENDKFKTEKLRKPRRYKRSQFYDAYYFIDDVSVKPIEDRTECQCGEEDKKEEPKFVFSSSPDVPDDATPMEEVEARSVHFAYETADIESNYKKELDKVASILKENPDLEIKVIGHADQKEGEKIDTEIDKDISLDRAKKVVEYLKEQGVSEDQLHIEAMQDSELVSKGKSQYLRSKNRRVNFEAR